MANASYIQGAELPDLLIAWRDSANNLIDFSSGYTFVLKLGTPGSAAALTKSTGITGAATSPNVTIVWAVAAELNTLAPGHYPAHLVATRTSDSKQRVFPFGVTVNPAIA